METNQNIVAQYSQSDTKEINVIHVAVLFILCDTGH